MTIDTRELISYLDNQIATFQTLGKLMPKNVFNDGVIQGINLVRQYVLIREEHEGAAIAKERGE